MNTHQIISTNLHIKGIVLSAAAQRQFDALSEIDKKKFLVAMELYLQGHREAKPLHGIDPKVTILRVKLDEKQRFLGIPKDVNNSEHYLYVTDILTDHNYNKAKCLKLKYEQMLRVINSSSTQRDFENYRLKKESAASALEKAKEKIYSINYLPVQCMNGRLFLYNSEQQKVLDNYTLPIVGLGSARSGKTSLTMSFIYDAISKGYGTKDKPIYYVAESKSLVKRMQDEWDAALTPQSANINVIFIATEELVQRYYPEQVIYDTDEGDQSTQEKARNKKPCQYWIKDHIKSYLEANDTKNAFNPENCFSLLLPHVIYAEFRIMSGYDTKEEYCKETEGERKSHYTWAQKEILWGLYEAYLSYLSKNDLRHVAFTNLPLDIAAILALDEFPDNSHQMIKALLKFTKNGNCILFGDYHQSLFDQHSKQDYLLKTIEKLKKLKITPVNLSYANQCSSEVVNLINNMLDLKFDHAGGKTDDYQYTEVKCLANDIKGEVSISSPDFESEEDKELLAYLKEKATNSPNIVIITLPEFKNEVKKLFEDKVIVLTPEEAKGQHFKVVIIYRMLDGKHDQAMLKEADLRVKMNKEKKKDNKNHKADRGIVTPILFNQLYTAITRGEDEVHLVQKRRHNIENIYDHISLAKKINPLRNITLIAKSSQFEWYERFQSIVIDELTGKLLPIGDEPQSKGFFLKHRNFFNEGDTYEVLVEKIKQKYNKTKNRYKISNNIIIPQEKNNSHSTLIITSQTKKSTSNYLKELLEHFNNTNVIDLLNKDNVIQLIFEAKFENKNLISHIKNDKRKFNLLLKCLKKTDGEGKPYVIRLLKSKNENIINMVQETFLCRFEFNELIIISNFISKYHLTGPNLFEAMTSNGKSLKDNFIFLLEAAIKNDCIHLFDKLFSNCHFTDEDLIHLADVAAEERNATIFQKLFDINGSRFSEIYLKRFKAIADKNGYEEMSQIVTECLTKISKNDVTNESLTSESNSHLTTTRSDSEESNNAPLSVNISKNENINNLQAKFDKLDLLNHFTAENLFNLLKDRDAEKLFFREVNRPINNKYIKQDQVHFVDYISTDKEKIKILTHCLEKLDENGIPYLLRLYQTPLKQKIFDYHRKMILMFLGQGTTEKFYNLFDLSLSHSLPLLTLAAKQIILDVFKFSIKNPRDRNLLLHNAISINKLRVVDYLLNSDDPLPDQKRVFLLHHAIQRAAIYNDTQILERLLQDPRILIVEDVNGDNPLHFALKLNIKTQEDENDDQLLHFALKIQNKLQIVKTLLYAGLKPVIYNGSGFNSLQLAVICKEDEILKLVLGYINRFEVNSKTKQHSWSALHMASQVKYSYAIRLLLEKGANPNLQDNDHATPLHFSVSKMDLESVKILLEYGADPTMAKNNHYTALHLALSDSSVEVVKVLLETNKFDATMFHKSKAITPLMIAVMFGSIEEIKLINGNYFTDQINMTKAISKRDFEDFIEVYKLDERLSGQCKQLLNFSIYSNCTPLHLAILRGELETVDYLIKQGADINLTTKNITVYILAEKVALGSKDKCYKTILNYLNEIKNTPEINHAEQHLNKTMRF